MEFTWKDTVCRLSFFLCISTGNKGLYSIFIYFWNFCQYPMPRSKTWHMLEDTPCFGNNSNEHSYAALRAQFRPRVSQLQGHSYIFMMNIGDYFLLPYPIWAMRNLFVYFTRSTKNHIARFFNYLLFCVYFLASLVYITVKAQAISLRRPRNFTLLENDNCHRAWYGRQC